jgi:hypothetical protein
MKMINERLHDRLRTPTLAKPLGEKNFSEGVHQNPDHQTDHQRGSNSHFAAPLLRLTTAFDHLRDGQTGKRERPENHSLRWGFCFYQQERRGTISYLDGRGGQTLNDVPDRRLRL